MINTTVGFYGKIPSHRDFIHVNLPRIFINSWDPWLQEIIFHWRNELSGDWVADYLTLTPYRFILSKGIAGEVHWMGVMVPSRDHIGRLFPLTICVPLPSKISPLEIQKNHNTWLNSVEKLAISCLQPSFNPENIHTSFLEDLMNLGLPDISTYTDSLQITPPDLLHNISCAEQDSRIALQQQFSFVQNNPNGFQKLAESLLDEYCHAYSLWWSKESQSVLYSQGLPDKSISPAFIDKKWNKWGWLGDQPSEHKPAPISEDDTQTLPN